CIASGGCPQGDKSHPPQSPFLRKGEDSQTRAQREHRGKRAVLTLFVRRGYRRQGCNRQKQYAYSTGLPGVACCSHASSGSSFGTASSHNFGRCRPSEVSTRAEALSPTPRKNRCSGLSGGSM